MVSRGFFSSKGITRIVGESGNCPHPQLGFDMFKNRRLGGEDFCIYHYSTELEY